MVILVLIYETPQGYAVTGGQDAVVNVFNLEKPRDDPDFSLLGHLDNVCALHVTPGGTIVSGSWDRSVKITHSTRIPFHFLQNGQSLEKLPSGIRIERPSTICVGRTWCGRRPVPDW